MTVATVITDVRRMVQDEPWEDYLGGAYTAGGATVTVTTYTMWEAGDRMDFPGVDSSGSYEEMRVKTTPSSTTVSVKTGHNDTTNQNHANGAVILKNPRFGTDQIAKAITHVVNTRLWPDIWVVATSSITPSPGTTVIYDLPSDYESFISLAQVASGALEDLTYARGLTELRNVPTAVSATNKALRVPNWPRVDVAATLFYRARVTTTSMTSEMEPLIALGAAAYLLTTEAHEKADRIDQDDNTLRMVRNARELERAFDQEKRRLKAALMPQWGQKRRFRRSQLPEMEGVW